MLSFSLHVSSDKCYTLALHLDGVGKRNKEEKNEKTKKEEIFFPGLQSGYLFSLFWTCIVFASMVGHQFCWIFQLLLEWKI